MIEKFTKGNWEAVTHDGGVKHAVIYIPNGGFDISNCPDAVANAHLIASAPEMYETLSMILRDDIKGVEMCQVIESVLARARGEL